MSVFKATIFILLLFVAVQISLQDVVDPHLACAEMGKYYGQGCSGLTAKLLGKPWKKVSLNLGIIFSYYTRSLHISKCNT